MLNRIIAVFMSAVISVTGMVYSAVNNIIDSVSELFFGIPYTAEAIKADFFSDIEESDVIQIDENNGIIDDKLVVFLNSELGFIKKLNVLSECGGVISGWCTPANLYVISTFDMSYDEAVSKCEKLNAIDGVELSIPASVSKTACNYTPNDPFGSSQSSETVWDEINPLGNNWWLEAINARQAWDYSDYFNTVKIGIVDSGFDTEHPELAGKITFPGSKEKDRNVADDHGTHVAGIIGANMDNEVGIAGVCSNSQLICIDWSPDLFQFWLPELAIFFSLSTVVKAGAKVVNFSLGTSSSKSDNSSSLMENVFKPMAYSYIMASLLNNGYDFIAVQSAGNGNAFYEPIDAVNNGHFSAVTAENIFTGSTGVSKQDILDRIIIVASADNVTNGKYELSFYSNVGSRVEIAAPGDSVYSCITGGEYESFSGTSMAAPIVSGVASLVWSVNPSFTGAQVKNIVCSSTKDVAAADPEQSYYYDVEAFDYPLVNAKLAVEEAVRRTDGSVGTVSGKIIGNGAETVVFNGVSHTVCSDGTYSFVAPEGTSDAEIFDKNGNLLGEFELTVSAGQFTEAEDYIISETE